jgi:hypothetical protein
VRSAPRRGRPGRSDTGAAEREAVTWEPLTLLRGVREVAALANPAAPLTVTQAAFDTARTRSPAYAGMPRAKRITEQLRLRRWSVVLTVAHEPEGKHNHLLGWKTMEEDADWLTVEYVASVLKLVAHRLGADTVSRPDYRDEREKLLAEDRKRWLHGQQLLVPKSAQIEQVMGTWTAALQAAGLRTRSEGVVERNATRAPTHAELLDLFWKHYPVLPTKRDLQAFALGNSIPYPTEAKAKFGEERDAWAEARRAEGVAVPDEPPPHGERADYSRDAGEALPGARRRRRWGNAADCVAAVKRYVEELRPGERAGAESYRAWARRQAGGAPAPKELEQHGGWAAVWRLARDELQREQASNPPPEQSQPQSRRSRPPHEAR